MKTITCHDTTILMNHALDGELPANQKQVFTNHLKSCAACRLEFERMTFIVKMLETAPEVEVPDHFNERILQALKPSWEYKLMTWFGELIPRYFFQPILAFTSFVMVVFILISYGTILTYAVRQFNLEAIKSFFLSSEIYKQTAYLLNDLIYLGYNMLQFVMNSLGYIKISFNISATLYPALSYMLPVAIISLLIWLTLVNYTINHQHRRWQYAVQ